MSKEIYISSTPHETRLAIVENDELTEIYYERENEYTLAGSIYNGRVTRVLPGMQSAFVDLGLERDAFLYITDFLEEAADSAEFEGEGRGSDSRGREGEGRGRDGDRTRDSRSRESRSREGRGAERDDRGYEERGRGQVTLEGERFGEEAAVAGAGERSRDRGADRERGDRRQGRDGRSGRGRGGDESRYGRPAAAAAEQPVFPQGDELRSETETALLRSPVLEGGADDAELNEGEPGAEGSRRWRGRRGRRRGRGGREAQGTVAAGAESQSAVPQEELAETPDLSSGYDLGASQLDEIEEREGEDVFDVGLRASQADGPESRSGVRSGRQENPLTAETSGAAEGEERYDSRERRARSGRDATAEGLGRYGQERRRDDQGSGERREGRGGRRELVRPRGFSPRGTPFASDFPEETGADSTVNAEPVQLPGESLARFGGGSRVEETQRASRSERDNVQSGPEVPSNFELAGSWDGGMVLPGETLRPRTPSTEGEERRPERSGDRERSGRGGERRREGRVGGGVRTEGRRSRGGEARREGSDRGRSGSRREGSDRGGRSRGGDGERRRRPESGYEPQEGSSASFRVDPDAPREFRLPAGFGDDDEGQGVPRSDGFGSDLTESAGAHLITPLNPVPLAAAEATSSRTDAAEATTGELGQPDVTNINAEGEMLSPAPVLPVIAESGSPTAPIEHESAVLEHEGTERLVVSPTVDASDDAGEALEQAEFAPDSDEDGDAEDFLATTIQAASIEEMDYEDDAVETSADLGSMIRDLSIDEITHAEGVGEDDGFAFEEEESLDDSEYQGMERQQEPVLSSFTGVSADDEGTGASGESNGYEQDRGRDRDRGGRDRGGRDRGRGGRERDRGGRSGERDRFRAGRGREGHRSAQTTNLPAISDLLKPGQELLVQIAKEPIAKKGARITSHIALPGRFLVFMPTVNHTGVSRKIESDHERRRLKDILLSEKGDAQGGFIVRTAAAGATEEELRNDLRFLLNLWADIKQRSDSSKSPALIYHDLNLVERILRDQVTDNFSAIWVDSEADYERILRFLQRFQPSLIRRVKLYTKETPLFEQFGISEEINKALRSKVWLKSGGSIVINQTEALVAIDINTGKYVGKTARLEDTIVKTNLDAIPEIVRQIRLRDLGGIIIIDFIDMDERRNRHRVMAALEEELKKDRAPSKVLQFNDFGLVAITRKRVKQSLERTLSTPCSVCTGTGMVKSAVTVCNDIYVEMRKMQKHLDRGDVLLRVNPEVVKQLKSPQARWLQEMEEMVGKTILVKSDPTLHPEQFDIH